jgi:hypothetical protein
VKILLGAVLILLVLYLISGSAITSLVSIGEKGGASIGGRRLTPSPFAITFRDQYLCRSETGDDWVMAGRDTGNECSGPYFDSPNLCRALAEVGQTRVQLYWEGRVLDCP